MDEKKAALARRFPSPEEIKRAATAFELSAAHFTEAEIAKRMEVSPATAHRLVKRGMRFYLADHGAETVKREMLGRMHLVIESLMPKVLEGDLAALDRLLKVEGRLAALLGVDAPKNVRVQWIQAEEIEDELTRLRQQRAAAAIPAESRVS